jgi:hypothetical protein
MTRSHLQQYWPALRAEAGFIWSGLTDEDLDRINGNAARLIAFLQARYGYERAIAEDQVERFLSRYSPTMFVKRPSRWWPQTDDVLELLS